MERFCSENIIMIYIYLELMQPFLCKIWICIYMDKYGQSELRPIRLYDKV